MTNLTHLGADMTERALAKIHAKRQKCELKDQIVRGVTELLRLSDRNAELYQALGNHRYTDYREMRDMQREMAANLTSINTQEDGLKLMLNELNKLEGESC